MPSRPVTSDALARLKAERDAADRDYNDALTGVDRALPRTPEVPPPPTAQDDGRLARLAAAADILQGTALPPARGFRTRLAHFVWRMVAPVFERQQAMNRLVLEELDAGRHRGRATADALGAIATSLSDQSAAVATFHAHLIRYFQQVTAYIDTRDRLEAGQLMAVYDSALDAVTDHVLRRAESAKLAEARFEGRVAAVAGSHEDLRRSLAVLQQATQTLRREVDRSLTGAAPGAPPAASGTARDALESYKYVCFEDLFRGSRDDIRARLETYVPLFAGASDVLDVGCGRGEFLDLLRAAGIHGRGLDLNHEMVEVCLSRGLDAVEGDLVGYLSGLPDGSLGGLIAVQVVEHLEPSYLMRALDLAFHKLRPGALIVLETINVASWFAFFASYVRDLTHVRPLHPETLQYLLTASGFEQARIQFRAPYPDADKLQHVPPPAEGDPAWVRDLADTVNANADRLNGLLFADLDYAAIARRP